MGRLYPLPQDFSGAEQGDDLPLPPTCSMEGSDGALISLSGGISISAQRANIPAPTWWKPVAMLLCWGSVSGAEWKVDSPNPTRQKQVCCKSCAKVVSEDWEGSWSSIPPRSGRSKQCPRSLSRVLSKASRGQAEPPSHQAALRLSKALWDQGHHCYSSPQPSWQRDQQGAKLPQTPSINENEKVSVGWG